MKQPVWLLDSLLLIVQASRLFLNSMRILSLYIIAIIRVWLVVFCWSWFVDDNVYHRFSVAPLNYFFHNYLDLIII